MLRIQLLGGFQLTSEDGPISGVSSTRLQHLLAYLLLHRVGPIARTQISSCFWPDSSEQQARNNLRKLIFTLRRNLPDADDHIQATSKNLIWQSRPGVNVCDVIEFEAAIEQAQQSHLPVDQERFLQEAVSHYTGDLLPGEYDEWLVVQRTRLRALFATSLATLTRLAEKRGDIEAALQWAETLLAHDPLQESSYRLVMHLHLLNDNRAAALRVYHAGAKRLREELGVDPSPATEEIYHRLLHMEEAGEVVLISSSGSDLLPLIGRSMEWQQLQRLWRQAQAGHPTLVLIRGEAGVGKTRLAEELVSMCGIRG